MFYFVPHHPPGLPLVQVCRRWRDVTLASPTLWSVFGACARFVPLFLQNLKYLDSPLQARGVVTRHDDREFLDCPPHLETDIHRFVYFEVDFCARFHGPFNRLTYAAPALESRRHSSTSSQCRLHKHLACFLEVVCRHCRNWPLRCLPWPNCLASSITLSTLINSSDLGSCDNLLSILESCANVEVLTLLSDSR